MQSRIWNELSTSVSASIFERLALSELHFLESQQAICHNYSNTIAPTHTPTPTLTPTSHFPNTHTN